MKIMPWWCSASLMAVALAPPLTAADTDKSVTLRAGPLPIDGQAMSPSCMAPTGEMDLTARLGTVLPGEKSEVKKDGQVTLCGTKFDFQVNNGEVAVLGSGGKPVRLKRHGDGVDAIPVPLPNKRQAVVSIPVVNSRGTSATIYFRSGMAMAGQLEGDALFLYDDDLDGNITTDKDVYSLGSGIVFAPLKAWLPTPKGLFRIASVDETGARLALQPATEKVGTIELKYANTLAEAHAVFSNKGKDCQVVLTGRKPMTVLSGSYSLQYGLLVNPATKTTFAGIIPGQLPATEVPSGGEKPIALAMGGPYRIGFKVTAPNRKVTIDPNSLQIFGKNEERYVDFRYKGMPSVSVNGKPIGSFEYG